jgi:hypothetical protein
MSILRRHVFAISMCIANVAALAACGGAAAPAGAQYASPTREPTTIEEAQAQLENARAELEPGTKKTESGSPTSSPVTPAPAPALSSSAPAGAADQSAGPQPECVTRCRAIASMRRAVAAICRMAGEEDARCTDARKVLQESEARVASCSC